jgi:hypothetical protein
MKLKPILESILNTVDDGQYKFTYEDKPKDKPLVINIL